MFSAQVGRASSPAADTGTPLLSGPALTVKMLESFADLVSYNSLKPDLYSIARLKNHTIIDIYNCHLLLNPPPPPPHKLFWRILGYLTSLPPL